MNTPRKKNNITGIMRYYLFWTIWASIPVPLACEASALPFELNALIKIIDATIYGIL